MKLFKSLWQWILRLFGITKTNTSNTQISDNSEYTRRYEDIEHINFTAIFAGKLSTLSTAESTVDVTGDTVRSELLGDVLSRLWAKIKKIVNRTFGTGGCVAVPYVANGKLYYSLISQDRLSINTKQGDLITCATILADELKINNETYYRWTTYKLNGNTVEITTRSTNSTGKAATVEQWADIADISISGVDRLPIAYIKSPIDNRSTRDDYGVPITYGCDEIIERIIKCLKQIDDEYEYKRVRLQVDERGFTRDKDGNPIMPSKLFMATTNATNDNLFNVFDPAIRDSAFYARLNNLFDQLEKQIGTSKGILTTPESHGATATEIKAGMYDTYAIISDMRKAVEDFITDFLSACDVLANAYNLSPAGEYDAVFDWSYSMIESSAETWQQLKDAQSMGVRSKAELRAWQTGETLDDAQEKIDEIKETEPNITALIGENV